MSTSPEITTPPPPETINEWAARARVAPVQIKSVPPQLATELLSTPGLRSTNHYRKTWSAARSKFFVSTREAKDGSAKAERKFREASIAQLKRWLARAVARARTTERALAKLSADNPAQELLFKALSFKLGLLHSTRDILQAEYLRRTNREKS